MAHIDDMPYKAFKKFVQQFDKVMVDIPRCEGSIEVTKKAIIEYCQYYDNQINVMYQPDFSVIYVQPYLDKR